jgi:hypothetical protein
MDESKASNSALMCECGRTVSPPRGAELSREWVEVGCACGRRLDLERTAGGWTVRTALVPEKSVPLDGFSRELRLREDTLRFWFQDLDGAGRRTNVHVVFSPSDGVAEIKRGDARALKLSDVSSPSEARRRWLERQGGSRAGQERRAGS